MSLQTDYTLITDETSTENSSSEDFSAYGNSSISFNLTSWHRAQLVGLTKAGINCLLNNWISLAQHPLTESHCDGAWDEIYCWPATLAGETVRAPCSEVMKDDEEIDAEKLIGDAFRICSENGTWLWGNWTNYNVCLASLDSMETPVSSIELNTKKNYCIDFGHWNGFP
ncbi:unnamed protein product [Allacma fusca]|uniref:G-protein coupled receptors family 2 profile 1 domain-containing protein n=1 Tax=Allacma fusca TaxID=39272 RepID=A0A8J2JMW0_9HEXA|nr:unnamed protein product [Allacma fusca]